MKVKTKKRVKKITEQYFECPSCTAVLSPKDKPQSCPLCGTKLEWEEEQKNETK